MIKVFRPFWSYDVTKTEEWLSSMAEKGYYFVVLNRWTRCFFFRQGEPKTITYRIGFDKMQGESLSKSLLNEGWVKVLQRGAWYFLSNEKPFEQIKTSSVREGIIKHNRLIMYVFIGVIIYLSVIALFNLTIMGFVMFQDVQVEVVESPMWILTYTLLGVAIGVYILGIFSIIKIKKTNKYLNSEKPNKLQGGNQIEERLSKEKEKQLKLSGQLVLKRKIGWMYAPDKLENWLETMEKLGFNLYRVGKTGTAFYFIKGSPRNVSYCADYQNIVNESYFDILRDTGWKSVFTSNSSLQKWTIWSREYAVDEERPEIYSEKSHQLKHAKRVALVYTIMFLPLVIIYMLNMGLIIGANNNATRLGLINMVLFMFCIFSFGSFIVRIWLYYVRLRKRYDLN